MFLELGAKKQQKKVTIHRSVFLKNAVHHNKPKDIFSYRRIHQSETRRLRGTYFNFTLVLLFILHAPVTNRLFRYFNCHDLSAGLSEKRLYLKSDYTVQCRTPEYMEFSYGFVVPFLVLFTFMLPLVISLLLCRFRKQLYSAKIQQLFGFIYAPFNSGSEFWEIHVRCFG